MKLRGRGAYEKNKSPIISMVSRSTGKVIFKVVPNLSKKLIGELISKYCNEPIQVFSDDYNIYEGLSTHKIVMSGLIILKENMLMVLYMIIIVKIRILY
ncbi:MAG: transposase [Methanobrevibacter sp.]|nr:transposase [Candidatus Methanovirga procula]